MSCPAQARAPGPISGAIDKISLPKLPLACQATSAAVLRRRGRDPSAWQGLWMALLATHAVVAHVSASDCWLGPDFVAARLHATALTTLLHPLLLRRCGWISAA